MPGDALGGDSGNSRNALRLTGYKHERQQFGEVAACPSSGAPGCHMPWEQPVISAPWAGPAAWVLLPHGLCCPSSPMRELHLGKEGSKGPGSVRAASARRCCLLLEQQKLPGPRWRGQREHSTAHTYPAAMVMPLWALAGSSPHCQQCLPVPQLHLLGAASTAEAKAVPLATLGPVFDQYTLL